MAHFIAGVVVFLLTSAWFVFLVGIMGFWNAGKPGTAATFGGRLAERAATVSIGIFLIFMLFFTSEWTMLESTGRAIMSMALCSGEGFGGYQIITAMFVHANDGHLMNNISFMALFSPYERRVGPGRYLAVFFFSGLTSSITDYFVLPPYVYSMGASAAIYGIIVAYFIDRLKPRVRDWLFAAGAIGLSVFFAYLSTVSFNDSGVEVNHVAHTVGGLTGALFCLVFPRQKPAGPVDKKPQPPRTYGTRQDRLL